MMRDTRRLAFTAQNISTEVLSKKCSFLLQCNGVRISFPKATRGNAVARVVQVPITFAYVDEMLNVVVNLCEQGSNLHATVQENHRRFFGSMAFFKR